jgi:dephospho-CoA kinase
MMPDMLRVGLTGNIGSGKSTVALALTRLGAHVIDADAVVHELLTPASAIYSKIVEAFGPEILRSDGTIDRRYLGRIVFDNPAKRSLLNSLVHPAVRAEVNRRTSEIEKRDPEATVVVEAALLVETGYYKHFDQVIVVTCAPEIQLARVMQRDGLSEHEVLSRMEAQMSTEEKARVADHRIDTSGTLEETEQQVAVVFRELRRRVGVQPSPPEG